MAHGEFVDGLGGVGVEVEFCAGAWDVEYGAACARGRGGVVERGWEVVGWGWGDAEDGDDGGEGCDGDGVFGASGGVSVYL